MSMCPKCFSEKPLAATHCPQCTHHSPFWEELGFNVISTILTWVFFILILMWIFG